MGLGLVYNVLYRYGSSVAVHPTLLAVDPLYEKGSKGLALRASQLRNSERRLSTCTERSSSIKLSAMVPNNRRHFGCLCCPRLAVNSGCWLSATPARSPDWPELLQSEAID